MLSILTRGETPVPRALVPTRVLVVDEEALIRWSICTALAAEGFDAVAASDPVEALRLASEWPPPKVAVIDSRLPGGDDRDLVSNIRRVYPDCRFLIMTTAQRGNGNGSSTPDGVAIIEKPFDLLTVVRMVTELTQSPGVVP